MGCGSRTRVSLMRRIPVRGLRTGGGRRFRGEASFKEHWGAGAIEVKTAPFQMDAFRGLLEFCRRYARFRPLVLTGAGDHIPAQRANVAALPWTEFLLTGPPSQTGA